MLFDSLIKSNPKHAPGWIAAAALEEHAGRMVAARKLIKQGCEQCPKSEDVWLEAARLHVCALYFCPAELSSWRRYSKMTTRKSFLPMLHNMWDKV
jgi:Tetratricopeptide repeat